MFQKLVALGNDFNISFNDCTGHKLWVHTQALLVSESLTLKAEKLSLTTTTNDFVKTQSNTTEIF